MSRSLGGTSLTTRSPIRSVPAGDLLEAGDHPQAGRLAAARWSDQDHELAVADLQVEVLHGLEIAVHLVDVLERHGRHGATSAPSGPSRAHASSRRERNVDGPRTWAARGRRIVGAPLPRRKAACPKPNPQARPRTRSISRPRTRSPSARSPLCTNSSVIHGRSPRIARRRLLGEGPLDVQVVDVDRRRHRDLVDAPAGPRRTGAAIRARRGSRPRPRAAASAAVVLEHPGEDVLGGEGHAVADLVGQQPVGRPARGDAVGVGRLVEGRVDRVAARSGRHRSRRRAGRPATPIGSSITWWRQLQAGTVAEPHAELPEAARGQPVARVAGGTPRRRVGDGCRGPGRGRPGSARSSARSCR